MASNIKTTSTFIVPPGQGDSGAEYEGSRHAPASPRRHSHAAWLITTGVLAALLGALFVSLGLWQWDKYERKTGLQAELDERSAAAAVGMPARPVDAEAMRYRRVVLRGEFETGRQILVDNRLHREQAGYHVITPLRLADSPMRVLVNRGWVPAPADHRVLPEVPAPAGTVELTGIAVVPATRFFSLAPQPAGWQPVWQHPDLKAIAATMPFPLQPVVVELDARSPHGYAREWPRPDERADKHRSYALQWFGFAAGVAGIWLWFLLRKS